MVIQSRRYPHQSKNHSLNNKRVIGSRVILRSQFKDLREMLNAFAKNKSSHEVHIFTRDIR